MSADDHRTVVEAVERAASEGDIDAWIALMRRAAPDGGHLLVSVNGLAGLLLDNAGSGPSLLAFTVDGGRVVRIDAVRNPAKLQRVRTGRA